MSDSEIELTINDYQLANETLEKVRARKLADKKLSRKDQAILVYAADAVAAHRTADLLRDCLPDPPMFAVSSVDEEVAAAVAQGRAAAVSRGWRLRYFRRMLMQAETALNRGLRIGEENFARSVRSDFESVFASELSE
ncbi:hypothetical protein SEA_SKYSAND_16 [Gordonia phage Skysand]|uniref:Uncharacterized protein n=1 Tax=Gordonia phage Skysand TaxID=2301559 RepID=A0A385DRI4_9CAUD|nr:hypothetical protein KNU08_gp16 [Gordonia phage Skysand]AXQ62050.1 hypothetical protein SEA_SKYSAND_16 [Gordonia phage Skysand]